MWNLKQRFITRTIAIQSIEPAAWQETYQACGGCTPDGLVFECHHECLVEPRDIQAPIGFGHLHMVDDACAGTFILALYMRGAMQVRCAHTKCARDGAIRKLHGPTQMVRNDAIGPQRRPTGFRTPYQSACTRLRLHTLHHQSLLCRFHRMPGTVKPTAG